MSDARLVDFHRHLDLYQDHVKQIAECEAAGVFTLSVTTTPRAWSRNQELVSSAKHVKTALGLHPQLVKEHAHEIALWRELLPQARYVGEVGLDASPQFYGSFDVQKAIFKSVLTECARAGGKVLTIHSVRAVRTVLECWKHTSLRHKEGSFCIGLPALTQRRSARPRWALISRSTPQCFRTLVIGRQSRFCRSAEY